MPNDDPEVLAAVRRYVVPDRRYMKLHGWNIRHMNDERRDEFGRSLTEAASRATGAELIPLLKSDWRARLVAAWLIAIGGREEYRSLLRKLLLEAEGNNDLKGFCFAITQFGTHADAEILSDYLTKSLSPAHSLTAQEWALGGLLRLDEHLDTSYANHFTGKDGLWKRWADIEPGPEAKELIDFLSGVANVFKPESIAGQQTSEVSPLAAYDSWQSRRLPAPWHMLTSEAVRTRIDSEVEALLDTYDLRNTEPLSVAACENCRANLFSARSEVGNWGLSSTIHQPGGQIEIFQSYADLWECLSRHAC
ncbi:DUF6000 family protein [Streptomyces noursei]|uniref:DUF6000 family protein n=1 Tax=Streptomyces noursei TaxID=1971 RepID=UPI00381203B6